MKKIIVCLVLFCLAALSVNAADVGVVVELPDGKVYAECVSLSEDSSAYDAFDMVDEYNDNIKMEWTGTGSLVFLNEINDISYDEYGEGKSWAFTTAEPGSTGFAIPPDKSPGISYGIGSYPLKEGGLIGLSYSTITFGIDWTVSDISPVPHYIPFNDICNSGITKVSVDPKKPKPGEEVEVDVSLDNNFEFDLENIELKVWFEDDNGNKLEDDDGDEIEDDSDFDLDEGDDENDLDDDEHIFSFQMPYDVDDNGEYYVYVTIEGKQANDSSIIYRDIDFSKSIKFSREKHEIEIYKFLVNPEEVKCSRNINIEIGLRNLGENDEDITFRIFNQEIGIDKTESLELESDADDNEYKNSYYFKINDEILEGDYFITLKVEYNDGEDYATKTANLKVENCEKKTSDIKTVTGQSTLPQTQQTTSQEKISTEKSAATTSTVDTTLSNRFLIAFVLGLVIIVIFGGLWVAKLLK